MIDWKNIKEDTRPKRHRWAPGYYTGQCALCSEWFIGDKRASMCADCAYKDLVNTPSEENRDNE